MSGAAGFVFSLGGFVVLSVLATLFLFVKPQSTIARRVLASIVAAYACMSIYAISHVLVAALGAAYRPLEAADVPSGKTVAVVMGSGGYTVRDWSGREYSLPDPYAASRAVEAARVYRLVEPVFVVASGGKVSPRQTSEATGLIVRETLVQLGVPKDRLILQITSRNTHEEVLLDTEVIRNLRADRVVVVTSDFHMRRAVGAFRAAGLEVTPAVSREPLPPRFWGDWVIPGERGLVTASAFAHEVLGIAYYRLRGWYR
jgi:uncharacterized SAM-binding protein YcdF (DUF218 family)